MHKYFIKTPWIAKKFFSSYVWSLPTNENDVYLTFDDGPHPTITPWVLDQLKQFDAKATFFCIGNNVEKHPDVYQKVLDGEHAIGNHTYHHLNGWKTDDNKYIDDVSAAAQLIKSNLFRPPHGRIRNSQAKRINAAMERDDVSIIMWDVLSADFDASFSPEQCLNNVLENVTAGSIIVFHDSEKAFNNLKYALPKTLESLKEAGYHFRKIKT
ncbi:MAG TPA: polysaccharide deacetylase family protein [Flavisolibacter sp.]|jgi:peptidoglycan/xylan/chitin deacetylase (PgdA/CDA1 family)|nr:polysaccharide deacetylase family protein [Flavisolibacter sp.]